MRETIGAFFPQAPQSAGNPLPFKVSIPSDSLFAACLLAPESSGNPLIAFLNSECGGNLVRDEMNGGLAMSDLSIVPNPAHSNSARVLFELEHGDNIRVNICDVLGRSRVASLSQVFAKGSNSLTVELSQLPAGVYFVNVEASDDHRTHRLLIQK